jgi:type IV/VI secretion system ImpK/VasF family protein
MEKKADYATELFRLASRELLYLTSFRQRVKKSLPVDVEDLAGDLEEIFEEQERQARRDPRLESLYEKARYPLVVLADELILHSGWSRASDWEPYLLEERYFKTNIGGDQYFTVCKDLRPDDVELGGILYAGLALGFRGKYRERPEKLSEARRKVYRLLSEYLAETVESRITPGAYHVLAQQARRLSPAVTLVRVAVVGLTVLAVYYVLTFAIWSLSVSDLRQLAAAMGV